MDKTDSAYSEVLNELYNDFAAFHKIGASAYTPGLDTTLELSRRLGNPHQRYECIHIGGTNGKGSTAHTLAAVLQAAGYRTGLYTSPHLTNFRERIRVNGKMIEKDFVVDFMHRFKKIHEDYHPSFFEAVTLMAFDYFAACKVDVAIIEVGLGGRLDSTNVIDPLLSVITNISKDHTALLGATEELIAAEKAGIIKPGKPVVIGKADSGVLDVFSNAATACNSDMIVASQSNIYNSATRQSDSILYTGTPWGDISGQLTGECQKENTATILCALREFEKIKGSLPAEAVHRGFAEVCTMTGLMGRWTIVAESPVKIICDTGHNIGGWELLGPALADIAAKGTLRMIIGFVNDKNIDAIFECMPRNAVYYFTAPSNDRARPAESTAEIAQKYGLRGVVCPTVAKAYDRAHHDSADGDTIFIGGSTFVVADFLEAYTV